MRNNFLDILSHKVEIPIIQRDYAHGRTDSKVNKIRKDFLDVLFEFIHKKSKNTVAEIELDFIYGFNEGVDEQGSYFIPIDGQQRITTLWLLYWIVAAKEKIPQKEKAFLSNFIYETRHSTTQFCSELTHFNPAFSEEGISAEIKNQTWYFETWDYDPSIRAMLVVLDDMEERYNLLNNENTWGLIGNNTCPFIFYKLDMKNVGLTDDLYIKMNSRGKALTDFEYFKAGFSDLISDPVQRERFEQSIDGKWIETIWYMVFESGLLNEDQDIALIVDDAFLNIFNFLTSVLSFKKEIKTSEGDHYSDTIETGELLTLIYSDAANQKFLFDTLDAICELQNSNPTFWDDVFYLGKIGFSQQKTRLFFLHAEKNLLKRCLFHYSEYRGLSFPEQLMLFSCLTNLKTPQKEFSTRIRNIRNLVVNSENELRESILGNSFDEVEQYVLNGDLGVLTNFKTDQIEEEKQKDHYLQQSPNDKEILWRLEDSDILRGSISLFPFDQFFGHRAKKFLEIFEEDEFISEFIQKSNLLLCFGDYTQDDGSLTNLMSGSKTIIRDFLRTPGYNKNQFNSKTRLVVMNCLDFFNANINETAQQKISDTLKDYSNNPKDWKYYFLKYELFRDACLYGFYQWEDEQYCIWKMRKKQFNGFHWDPFLYEIFQSLQLKNLSLGDNGAKLIATGSGNQIGISSTSNGFLFESVMGSNVSNLLLDDLIRDGILNSKGELIVSQNNDGFDLQDRIELIKGTLRNLRGE